MKSSCVLVSCCIFLLTISIYSKSFGQSIPARHEVTLQEAHVGDLEIDTKLLDSYELLPNNVRQFYLDARLVFSENKDADFNHPKILQVARKHKIDLMGGPLVGDLRQDGATIWLRPSTANALTVKVKKTDGNGEKSYIKKTVEPGVEQRIRMEGLMPDTDYEYFVFAKKREISKGKFKTAPSSDEKGIFRVAFGSCFHKIGLHNPNLIKQIVSRQPHAMLLLGDLAVDDRENNINMHRSDYLLRDVSNAWQRLAANVPLYTSWDDHDYLNNDLSGIPDRFTKADREKLRAVWYQNWNNPEYKKEGIYFNTRIGPVELIMLDTRSCRKVEERGKYGSYLGLEQQEWLKDVLKNSEAPFKIISSGTMWSNYVTNGKDSWGTWDTLAREEIFNLIELENIPGVLLISGDRHGARGFTIPRSEGFKLFEFEPASLGGVPGPEAMVKDTTNQLFGYFGTDIIAFGEFTFNTHGTEPHVVFRLIDQFGKVLEEHSLTYEQLMP